MTLQPELEQHKKSWRQVFIALLSRRMLVSFIMGFAGGLPLLLTGSLLQAWMVKGHIDLGTIGLFALVGLPYTLKFLWAPIMDRYVPSLLGRRRGWLVIWQIALTGSIALLAFSNPAHLLYVTALAALLLSFFSASQDIVIDAYRRESMSDDEQGMGASLYVSGYRLGMLLASGGGLIMAGFMPYQYVYLIMAFTMACCIFGTLYAREPEMQQGHPTTLSEAVFEPFLEYFNRENAFAILAFILLYKIGDIMATQMTTPLYLNLGFSTEEIGSIAKLFGFSAVIAGTLLGGVLIMRIGIYKSLLWFGVLQGISTAGFAVLALVGHSMVWLAAVVAFENISGGLGTAAYVGFMASLTNKKFTATQYALLTSFMGIPRVFAAAPTGYLAQSIGWPTFFVFCSLSAIPGLLLLMWLNRRMHIHH
jgi:PAT family beta-lactamase induction signal transducer AmpG